MVLAPEHPFVSEITTAENEEAVEAYIKACSAKSDLDRTDLNKDKSGVFTGAFAINPVNNEEIPIWIADYVMMGYGTGAIMAVPAHDERDFEFATKFDLPIRKVVGSVGVPPTQSKYLDRSEKIEKHRPTSLPHWQQSEKLFFVTWRLADSLPQEKLAEWEKQRNQWLTEHPEPWDEATEDEYHETFSNQIDKWLDDGEGECVLRDPEIAGIVKDALLHFDGERYDMDSFVVMPNHVHVLFQLRDAHKLEDVIQTWKSFTAKKINSALGREGTLWQRDYWDRILRGGKHVGNVRRYIGRNPEKARLREGEFTAYEGGVGETPTLHVGDGSAINSGFLDGLPTKKAKGAMIHWLVEHEKGERKIQFKLRDWLFSRQRYWGEPFPITWKGGEHFPLPDSELPLLAPPLEDYKPSGSPEPILTKAKDWMELGDGAIRETNTMPQWAGSCWYYLRYCDPGNSERFISKEAEDYWSSEKPGMVDLYVGGTEHAVLHLLYARFWHKVLFDLGHVSTPEPFQRLVNQGLIMGEDGQKMSKSRGNVVNPDDVVSEYGADSLRLYEMFMGPLEQVKPWQMKGVEGVSRFLARVWRLAVTDEGEVSPKIRDEKCTDPELIRVVHETIKKVGEDIEKLSFNTAISQMMICTNAFTQTETVSLKEFVNFLTVLNPFAPHLTEEIHERLCTEVWQGSGTSLGNSLA